MENVINASADLSKASSVQDLAPPVSGRLSRNSIGFPPAFQGSRRNSSFVRYDLLDDTDKTPHAPERRVIINVTGKKFDVPLSTLAKHPETLLGNPLRFHRYYDPARDEYYFNRDRSCFQSIVAYYQSGLLRRPNNVRLDTFVTECRFFELDSDAFSQFCKDEGFVKEEPEPLPSNPVARRIWQFVELPQSSPGAKFFAIFSMMIIIISIVVFCAETLPRFRGSAGIGYEPHTNGTVTQETLAKGYEQFTDPLFIIESVCIAWFTIEFLLRLITSPDKKKFLKSPLNIIDFVAILPYYIDLAIFLATLHSGGDATSHGGVLTVLRILRLVRVFRIFKLSRHSRGMQILGQTFLLSIRELGLLLLFLGIGVVLFSSAVYYAEQGVYDDTQFESIPEAFWWAIVTMTTVGYGDIAPKGVLGKIVGTFCAVSGLIAVALPVPVIVANFNTIYQRERDRPQVEDILSDVLKADELDVDVPVRHIRDDFRSSNGKIFTVKEETEPMIRA